MQLFFIDKIFYTMKSDLLHFETAESFPGECKKRYFSSSYKKIKYHFADILVVDKKLIGVLDVQWPDVWAQKQNKDLPPH
jgi:hypothetical protein